MPPILAGDEVLRILLTKEEVVSSFYLSLAIFIGRFSLKY